MSNRNRVELLMSQETKTQISHALIRCISIVHDKTKKAECEKRLRGGPQLYETLGVGVMDVTNYQAAKLFGALPN
jgi:hypothetical protein